MKERLHKSLTIEKIIFYLGFGIVTIVFNEGMQGHLALIVGLLMVLSSAKELIIDISEHRIIEKNNTMAVHAACIIVGLLLALQMQNQIAYVCIVWGVYSIIDTCFDITDTIYENQHRPAKKWVPFLIDEVAEIIMAAMLLINPLEHVKLHIIILGVEMILRALRITRDVTKYHRDRILQEHLERD